MRKTEIKQLKDKGQKMEEIFRTAVSRMGLFGHAYFSFHSTRAEKQRINRLWNRIHEVFGYNKEAKS